MILVDAGNSRLKIKRLVAGGYQSIEFDAINNAEQVWVASVRSNQWNQEFAQKVIKQTTQAPIFIKSRSIAGVIKLAYQDEAKLGVDRYLVMLALCEEIPSFVVIDAGTATTVDVVINREHFGGYILPGIELCRAALKLHTAQVKPQEAGLTRLNPGLDTESCVQSGLLAMQVGAIDVLLKQFSELSNIVITGGAGLALVDNFTSSRYCADLVFDGMQKVIWHYEMAVWDISRDECGILWY